MHIDITSLLAPIHTQAPCGEDYSFSNEFHAIKKKPRLKMMSCWIRSDWITEPKQADWDFVAVTSVELLQSKSKDIRLLTWLTEAWANLYGFEGIYKGLELSHRLLEHYWLTLHPEVEEDDLDQRIGLLQGLINQLPLLIKKVPLINHVPFIIYLIMITFYIMKIFVVNKVMIMKARSVQMNWNNLSGLYSIPISSFNAKITNLLMRFYSTGQH